MIGDRSAILDGEIVPLGEEGRPDLGRLSLRLGDRLEASCVVVGCQGPGDVDWLRRLLPRWRVDDEAPYERGLTIVQSLRGSPYTERGHSQADGPADRFEANQLDARNSVTVSTEPYRVPHQQPA